MKMLIVMAVGLMFAALDADSTFKTRPPQGDLVGDFTQKTHLLEFHKGGTDTCTPKVMVFSLGEDEKSVALIADTTFYDRSGFSWCVVKIGKNGRAGDDFWTGNSAHIWCRESELYTVRVRGMLNRFIALNAEVNANEIGDGVLRRERSCRGDVLIGSEGQSGSLLSVRRLDDIVFDPDFRLLERAHAEVYAGFDMKRLPPDKRFSAPEKEILPNGGLVAPVGFPAFVRRYREEVKQRLGLMRLVTVYAVFLDADLDGDADFYVSSDAESVGDNRYHWTLYLNDANVFRKAKERVWLNRGTIHDVAMLEPEDVAGMGSFYRVVRTHGLPQILVMESDGERLHTHAYTHLLSEKDRLRRPSKDSELRRNGKYCFEDWEGEMRKEYGFNPPMDFSDQVSWLFFHHLERLACKEFLDEQ